MNLQRQYVERLSKLLLTMQMPRKLLADLMAEVASFTVFMSIEGKFKQFVHHWSKFPLQYFFMNNNLQVLIHAHEYSKTYG